MCLWLLWYEHWAKPNLPASSTFTCPSSSSTCRSTAYQCMLYKCFGKSYNQLPGTDKGCNFNSPASVSWLPQWHHLVIFPSPMKPRCSLFEIPFEGAGTLEIHASNGFYSWLYEGVFESLGQTMPFAAAAASGWFLKLLRCPGRRTQMTPLLNGKGLVLGGWPSETEVSWVLYIYVVCKHSWSWWCFSPREYFGSLRSPHN